MPALARFHLHPAVRASLTSDGTGALLTLASGEVWSFAAGGLHVAIEESIFLAAADSRRRSEQLVVAFDAVETPRIAWRFARVPGLFSAHPLVPEPAGIPTPEA
jgi:uncharacterized heparinase superfamily protein